MSTIFLSHNHRDKPFVRRLAADLKRRGARVWVDEAEIQVGDSLIQKIRGALDRVDYVGAVISTHSIDSPWVQKELELATMMEMESGKVKVLPLLLTTCQMPGFLMGKLYADFRNPEDYARSMELIADRLGLPAQHPLSRQEATQLIEAFARERGIHFREIEGATQSRFGTYCYKARASDSMGVIYLHASGSMAGQAYYVRRGIGILYETILGGSTSRLGLPTSNEELVDGQQGAPTNYFEAGYIYWSPDTRIAHAVLREGSKETILREERV